MKSRRRYDDRLTSSTLLMWVRVTTSEGDGRIRMIAMLPCAVREAAGAFRAGYQCDGETWLSSCDTAVTRAGTVCSTERYWVRRARATDRLQRRSYRPPASLD